MIPYMGIWKDGNAHDIDWHAIKNDTSEDFMMHLKELNQSLSPYIFALHYCQLVDRYHYFFYQEKFILYVIFDPIEKTWQTNILPIYLMGKMDAFIYLVEQRLKVNIDHFKQSCLTLEEDVIA